MNAYAIMYTDSVCWSAIGGTPNSAPMAGNAGKYMSTANGPSIDERRQQGRESPRAPMRRAAPAPPAVIVARSALERGVDRGAVVARREQRDERVDVAAQEHAVAQPEPGRRRREQVIGVELVELRVARRDRRPSAR